MDGSFLRYAVFVVPRAGSHSEEVPHVAHEDEENRSAICRPAQPARYRPKKVYNNIKVCDNIQERQSSRRPTVPASSRSIVICAAECEAQICFASRFNAASACGDW